ncbi:MAG: hypothetical protein AAF989_03595, partial [Planctomycetota bacterium]
MNDDEEALSLEDLGAAYAKAAAEHDPESFSAPESVRADEAEPNEDAIEPDSDQVEGEPDE